MTNDNHIELLFREHYGQLHRMARVLLHDDELARDIVHDVFAALLNGEKSGVASFGYLINAVRNRCINHIRDTSVRQRLASVYYMDSDEYEIEDWPDEATISRIYGIIENELTPRCRRVMELRFVQGLKFSEIAGTLGISEVAVYGHVRQAIIKIRQKLDTNG